MKQNVYNLIWADDDIDNLLDEITSKNLKSKGFNVIGAHNGLELEDVLKKHANNIDAVIVDANFNESISTTNDERDTSGLDWARGLYCSVYNKKIPFYLFTNRTDEVLKDIYKNKPLFLEDFPRHKRWFNKSAEGEFNKMLKILKEEVDEACSPSFIIRNRYQYELNAAGVIPGAYETLLDFLIKDYNDDLSNIIEPFTSLRIIIEKVFARCERHKLIPPISNNTNGTARYFLDDVFSIKDPITKKWSDQYKAKQSIMPKPLAHSLNAAVALTQDGSHGRDKLKLDVNKYFEQTKDTLLVKTVLYTVIDLVKWFAQTAAERMDIEINQTLWEKA